MSHSWRKKVDNSDSSSDSSECDDSEWKKGNVNSSIKQISESSDESEILNKPTKNIVIPESSDEDEDGDGEDLTKEFSRIESSFIQQDLNRTNTVITLSSETDSDEEGHVQTEDSSRDSDIVSDSPIAIKKAFVRKISYSDESDETDDVATNYNGKRSGVPHSQSDQSASEICEIDDSATSTLNGSEIIDSEVSSISDGKENLSIKDGTVHDSTAISTSQGSLQNNFFHIDDSEVSSISDGKASHTSTIDVQNNTTGANGQASLLNDNFRIDDSEVSSISDGKASDSSTIDVPNNTAESNGHASLLSDAIQIDDSDVLVISDDEVTISNVDNCLVDDAKEATLPNTASASHSSAQPDFHAMQRMSNYKDQLAKLAVKEQELAQSLNAMACVNLPTLPDGGKRLQTRTLHLREEVDKIKKHLETLQSDGLDPHLKKPLPSVKPTAWRDIRNTADIQHGMGDKAMMNHLAEKSNVLDCLKAVHDSLKFVPGEDSVAEDPSNLNCSLMPHQRQALSWMLWREAQSPPGGILADDMGLGKTLTVLSLILKYIDNGGEELSESEDEEDQDEDKYGRKNWLSKKKKKRSVRGGTLVVCPASLLNQWESEVERHIKSGVLTVELYHGAKREQRAYRLARKFLVITTYSIIQSELDKWGPIHQVKWRRIVLDEAHIIRNNQSKTSLAVCSLSAKYHWILTGTPIHNKKKDLFALFKFLQCSPFDELGVWSRWIEGKDMEQCQKRLSLLIQSLMLRRTKAELQEKDELQCLPSKELHEVEVKLFDAEMEVYAKVLEHSKKLFAEFLHQRAEKELHLSGGGEYQKLDFRAAGAHPFSQHSKMGKMVNRYQNMGVEIKSHVILVLLLRLRQICCHPGLIESMLDQEEAAAGGVEEADMGDVDDMSLIKQIKGLNISGDNETKEECEENVLVKSNPVFDLSKISSKIQAVINVLEEKVLPTNDKAVIVSQWASMLSIISKHLDNKNVKYDSLTGAIPVMKRGPIINAFNKKNGGPKVLLLSLTAGGVGLNLVGGSHLFLCDLHWNPQLEAQACDRVYRVGQLKPVHIYKFICDGTIESTIKILQEKKLALASDVLTGSHNAEANKLTLQDLKMLFDVAS